MIFNIKDVDLDKIIKEIEEDRIKVKKILEGKIKDIQLKNIIKPILFIVESPNKAKTIANFFGKPSSRRIGNINAYEVSLGDKHLIIVATKGHLVDLIKEENRFLYGVDFKNNLFIPIYSPIRKCRDCGYQFTKYIDNIKKCPICGSNNIDDAYERIKALQDLASEVDYIVIGTDPDEEGEFIAYVVYLITKPFSREIYRAEFHEVTKSAILKALEELKDIDRNKVKSQIVRRIEDRWLGFSLSEKLRKIFENERLSAGRVQTPVLGWIVDRYKEHKKSFRYFIGIFAEGFNYVIDLDIKKRSEAVKIKNLLKGSKIYFNKIEEYEKEINPLPPYMTSTLLQDATNILGLSADKVMQLAQDLFEAGLCTYHRTDSIHVSNVGIQIAKEYISDKFGENYFKGRHWGEEGTHECIRPTKPIDPQTLMNLVSSGELELYINLTKKHYALYSLIFNRFMQSQMVPVLAKYAKIDIEIPSIKYKSGIEGIINIIRHGWDLINDYRIKTQFLKIPKKAITISEVKIWRSAKVRLYSQAEVINLMQEKKIGRPSTYATIVTKLIKRGYVLHKNRKMIPTKLGIYVYKFLAKKYEPYISEEKTRELEEIMEKIKNAEIDYQKVLKDLYKETIDILKQKDSKEELKKIIEEANKEFNFNVRKNFKS